MRSQILKIIFNPNNKDSIPFIHSMGNARGILKEDPIRSSNTEVRSDRKRYCLWTLIFLLAIMGLCNLFLSITIIAVLRVNQGMESMEVIPDENLIKFFGKTDLDGVGKTWCSHSIPHIVIYRQFGLRLIDQSEFISFAPLAYK